MLWQCYDYGLVRLLDKKHHNRFRKDHLLDFSHTKLLWHLVTNIWFLAAYTSGKNQDISHRQIWFDSIWFSNVETTVVFVLAAIWNSWQLVHIYIFLAEKWYHTHETIRFRVFSFYRNLQCQHFLSGNWALVSMPYNVNPLLYVLLPTPKF